MKRLCYIILCMVLVLGSTACGKKEEPEPEIVEPTPEPTLEELLGFTAYDLMAQNPEHRYQDYHIKAEYTINEVVGNRTVEHQYKDTIIHEFDGTIARDILTTTEVSEGIETNRSETVWRNKSEGQAYFIVNYEGWQYRDLSQYDHEVSPAMSSKVVSELFERNNVGLRINGNSPDLYDSSLDNAIRYFIGKFGATRAAYTFEAQYEDMTNELRSVKATITVPDEITIGDNRAVFTSMFVTLTPVEFDEQRMIGIPAYVYANATEWIDPTAEPVVVEPEIIPLDTSVPVCVSMYEQEPNYEAFCEYIKEAGLTPESLAESSGLDGNSVFDSMTQLMVYPTYDALTEYDVGAATEETKWAYNFIMDLCAPRVNVQQPEEPEDQEEQESQEVQEEPAPTEEPKKPVSNDPV